MEKTAFRAELLANRTKYLSLTHSHATNAEVALIKFLISSSMTQVEFSQAHHITQGTFSIIRNDYVRIFYSTVFHHLRILEDTKNELISDGALANVDNEQNWKYKICADYIYRYFEPQIKKGRLTVYKLSEYIAQLEAITNIKNPELFNRDMQRQLLIIADFISKKDREEKK